MPETPNILVICSDQHNPAVTGCYGNAIIETPNLDRLAREGTCFDAAYCNQPICVPSRMSFLTGRYPSRIGVLGNRSILDSRIPTYAHMLAGAGYRTVLAGRMHFVGPDQYHGFQQRIGSDHTGYAFHCGKINRYQPLVGLLGNGGRPDPLLEVGQGATCTQQVDRDTTAVATGWLESYNASAADAPFMMTVGYFSPHCPYVAAREYYRKYHGRVTPAAVSADEIDALHPYHKRYREAIEIGRVPEGNLHKATAAYYGLVDFLDDEIGKLLDTLERTALLENTVILYFSDHGEMLGEHGRWHKQTFFESSSRVPLIVRLPASMPRARVSTEDGAGSLAGGRVTDPVSLVDIFPTICGLADREVPFAIDGTSLLTSTEAGRPVFVEYHDAFGSHRMIRQGRWKLNSYAGFETSELFDLHEDPDEKRNLSGDPAHAALERDLRGRLFADGWSGAIRADHEAFLNTIGYPEVLRMGPPTQRLIEAGAITDVPGYDVAVSRYENRIEE